MHIYMKYLYWIVIHIKLLEVMLDILHRFYHPNVVISANSIKTHPPSIVQGPTTLSTKLFSLDAQYYRV